jgi:hypothetical protein
MKRKNRAKKNKLQMLWDAWCDYQASQRCKHIDKIKSLQSEVFATNPI